MQLKQVFRGIFTFTTIIIGTSTIVSLQAAIAQESLNQEVPVEESLDQEVPAEDASDPIPNLPSSNVDESSYQRVGRDATLPFS